MSLRVLAAGALIALSAALAFVLSAMPMLDKAENPHWVDHGSGAGNLVVRGGLAFMELSGTPDERGRQHGALAGAQIANLLAFMRLNPMERVTASHLAGCLAAITPDDRREIAALAEGSGVPLHDLLNANATIETMCSAVVRVPPGGAPVVARNMDFIPAGPLGQATVVQVVRSPGHLTYAAVSWPGFVGVISGLNARGLSACILLNWHGAAVAPAEPLPLRVRKILAECADVESALAVLGASPVGSRHYLLLADSCSAAVAWWTPQGLHIDRPTDGWLVVTNLARTGGVPIANDPRGCGLQRCITALTAEPDATWFRRVVSASYLRGENAQAMVFSPATRHLDLALGAGFEPAVLRAWSSVALGAILDGAPVGTAEVMNLPAETPLRHYLQAEP